MKLLSALILGYILAIAYAATIVIPPPAPSGSSESENESGEEMAGNLNNTPKNLYVVKAVVYEIGILTDVDDNDTSSFESQERVDLTFFDAHSNQSHIDLGNIPLPIQTNVSGQVLTGIAPINIGSFSSPSELLQTLPLTGTIVNITQSNTAYYKLTTSNVTDADKPRIVNGQDLKNVNQLFPSLSPSQLLSQDETNQIQANTS